MDDIESRSARGKKALERLDRALTRLERALARRSDQQAMADNLAQARSDYERLATTVRSVEAGLDGVRVRIQAVLGS